MLYPREPDAERKTKVCITGGSGLLGTNWGLEMAGSYDVVLGLNERRVHPWFARTAFVDFESVDAIKAWLELESPSLVVNTIGYTGVEQCEVNPECAHEVNVNTAVKVATACLICGVKLVHISTDQLFDGRCEFVKEDQPVSPLNVYGKTKAESEEKVLHINDQALIVRANFFGWGPLYRQSFSDWILASLRGGLPAKVYSDIWFTPMLIASLARVVHRLADLGASGIYHVTGDERLSKYDFGLKLAAVFNFDPRLVEPIRCRGRQALVKRPRDMSLDNSKTRALLGVSLGDSDEHLEGLLAQKVLGVKSAMESI